MSRGLVYETTGQQVCEGSPYDVLSKAYWKYPGSFDEFRKSPEFRPLALAELEFLKGLKK